MRYLGIDWGEARIGLATGNSELKIASPLKVVNNFRQVLEVIKEENIDIAVLGKPVKMSGKDEFLDTFKEFYRKLDKKIKVELFDERLTSKAADALPGDKKTKALQDAIAAMLTLQNFFDRMEIK